MAASDLQVTATRGRVPPDVVPTVGEDSISAAQGASGRSSDALKEVYSSPGSKWIILFPELSQIKTSNVDHPLP